MRNQINFIGIEADDSQSRWSLIGKLSKAVILGGTKITAAASTVKVTFSTFDALPFEFSSNVEHIDLGPEVESLFRFVDPIEVTKDGPGDSVDNILGTDHASGPVM